MVHVPTRQVRRVPSGSRRRDLYDFFGSVPVDCRTAKNRLAAVTDGFESSAAQQFAGIVGGVDVHLLQQFLWCWLRRLDEAHATIGVSYETTGSEWTAFSTTCCSSCCACGCFCGASRALLICRRHFRREREEGLWIDKRLMLNGCKVF